MSTIRNLPNATALIVDRCIELVQRFEGIVDGNPRTVNLDPYLCPAGYWTIGWGHVVKNNRGQMLHGASSKEQAYAMFPAGITRAQALVLLRQDLTAFANFVRRVAPDTTLNQAAALTSFAFNLGNGNLKNSALLRNIRANNITVQLITTGFLSWVSANGRVLDGLIARRVAEAILFFDGITPAINIYNVAKQDVQTRRNRNLDEINRRNRIL